MTTVALYARVSSKNQVQNNTIKSQIAELKRRIALDGHELLSEYIFTDDARSGLTLKREGLEALRKKVAEGKINKIYIHSLDRLSRDLVDQRNLIDEFIDAGVEVIFSNHKVDDTPESGLMTDVQGALGTFALKQTVERSSRGKIYAAKEGYVSVITVAPYGYDRIRHFEREKIRFEINEEEAKIVRQIFVWIGQERVSIREVIRRLRDRSIRTRSGKKVWRPIVIWKMLTNPAYTGRAAFGKLKRVKRRRKNKQKVSIYRTDENSWIYIPVPKIIDEGLFNKVQKQLDENRKRARVQREGKKKYLLQSLVVCQSCKYAYSGAQCGGGKEKNSYYRCSSTTRITDGKKKCDNKLIRTEVLETAVWEKVKDLLKNPEIIKKEYQRRIAENKSDEPLSKKLARREEEIKEGMEELMKDYYGKENEGKKRYISKEMFEQTIRALNESLKEIEKEKKKKTNQKAIKTGINRIISSIKNFYSSIKSNLEQLDWEIKRRIIKALIGRIDIGRDQVEIGFQIEEPAEDGKISNLYHCTTYHNIEAICLTSQSVQVKMTRKLVFGVLLFNFSHYVHCMSF